MRYLFALVLTCAAFPLTGQQPGIDIAWLPITETERAQKAPLVDKNAGVEAIFWRVHVLDEIQGQDLRRVYYHYLRLKVFDEKGASQLSSIDIPIEQKSNIVSLVGRTIKPDGSELELTKDSIHERDLVKTTARKVRIESFSMPAVSPGAIVEHRWKEINNDPQILYTRLQFQREYPVERVTYYLKPLSNQYTGYVMSIRPFHCAPSEPKLERDGFSSVSLENIPAFHEEPLMPGELDLKQWALIYYHTDLKREPQKYWNDTAKRLYNDDLKPAMHVSEDIKQAAKSAIEDADSDDKKMQGLIRYIRGHMRDLYGSQVTDAERSKLFKTLPKDRLRTSVEVFKSGVGSDNELNTLLAAMASQAGLEAKPALVGNRDYVTFNPQIADAYFLPSIDMALNIDGKWKLYDVSQRNNPAGMLSSLEEGMKALIGDPKTPVFVDVPIAAPEESRATHTGKFALSVEGTLEGDAVEALTGHLGAERRAGMRGESDARRLEIAKERITKVFPEAEVTALKIEDFDPDHALKISYHVKIEHYAQRTGKRMLFQPMYFQQGDPAVFTSAERKYPVVFPFAWSESDDFTITLPDGFALDNASNKPSLNFGAPGSYDLKFSMAKDTREFICRRQLVFGKEQQIYFPAQSYAALKHAFDEIHARDTEAISLKVEEAAK